MRCYLFLARTSFPRPGCHHHRDGLSARLAGPDARSRPVPVRFLAWYIGGCDAMDASIDSRKIVKKFNFTITPP
jgi:hypothetical protein